MSRNREEKDVEGERGLDRHGEEAETGRGVERDKKETERERVTQESGQRQG
jgi:hypothetical protein